MSDLNVEASGNVLTITRSFAAPRNLVFRAFTNSDELVKWWGPKGFTTSVVTMDVRPGGTWHYVMRSPEWGEAWSIVTYREVTPPERLVYTDAFSDAAGTINQDLPQSTVTAEFAESNGRTTVTMRGEYASADDVRKVVEMGMEDGISSQFERLDDLLADTPVMS